MIPVDDLRFFIALVNAGSLASSAREMNVTPSAVTQRLQQMERRLGIRLVDRSTRSMRLTDEGELLASKGATICAENDALFDELISRRGVVSGRLKINAPLGFGRRYLAPLIAQFHTDHPQVEIAISLYDRIALTEIQSADVTFHIGHLNDSTLVRYRIAENTRILCASPSYVRRKGMPSTPTDLSAHDCLVLRENNEDSTLWDFSKGRTKKRVRISPTLTSNDGEVIHQWALLGKGVMIRSEWDVAENLGKGRLVRLLPGWCLAPADIIALVPQRRGMSARVKMFIEFVTRQVGPVPPWRMDITRSR